MLVEIIIILSGIVVFLAMFFYIKQQDESILFKEQEIEFLRAEVQHLKERERPIINTLEQAESASEVFLGTLGDWYKNNIIPVENFDIHFTPNVCRIEKFIDINGKVMVNMWYGSEI
ncbi:hypothetical protein [Sinanaerobacter sp. ZZT-01]|uniref:hypothetical protein n=1 Tax=Sinanaerobacter sp. ZZT-01 TaxID=3111540 RepID=UPI002D77C98B|nr:hypothetical protein [Sinanaerobacter sp. ZZT-01]WRR94202.1 hypothetical protein U5921_03525 [Sinanaerobacter sp. ZZT-01]